MDFIKIKICSSRGTVKSQPDRENGLQPQTLYLSNLYLKPKNNTKPSAVLTGKQSEQTPYEEQTDQKAWGSQRPWLLAELVSAPRGAEARLPPAALRSRRPRARAPPRRQVGPESVASRGVAEGGQPSPLIARPSVVL